MSTESAPAVVELADTFAIVPLELRIRTVTPPVGAAAPRNTEAEVISPPPTVRLLVIVMAGALTVTTKFAFGRCRKPGIVAETVVEPVPTGSKATPPATTVWGE